jgi:hypothetical protein
MVAILGKMTTLLLTTAYPVLAAPVVWYFGVYPHRGEQILSLQNCGNRKNDYTVADYCPVLEAPVVWYFGVYRGEQILSLQNGGNIGRRLPKLLPAKNKKKFMFFLILHPCKCPVTRKVFFYKILRVFFSAVDATSVYLFLRNLSASVSSVLCLLSAKTTCPNVVCFVCYS